MPSSPSPDSPLFPQNSDYPFDGPRKREEHGWFRRERTLRKARQQFDNLGRIPYDTAVDLMELGFYPGGLEIKWEQENSRSTAPDAEQ